MILLKSTRGATPGEEGAPNGSTRAWAVDDVLDAMLTTTGFESAVVFLREGQSSGIDFAGHRGSCREEFTSITHFEDYEGIPGLVAGEGMPQKLDDVSLDDRYLRAAVKKAGFHNYVCVPIPGRRRTAGCIEAASRVFSEQLLSQWLTIAREAERLGLILDDIEDDAHAEAAAAALADPSSRLELKVLGGFEARRAGMTLGAESFARRRAVTLLKILLTNYSKTVIRDELIELLWPSETPKDGAQLLKIVVHYLRRGLGQAENGKNDTAFILTEPNGYCFNPNSVHRIDALEFEKLADEGLHFERRGRWREALLALQAAAEIYTGDYLQDEPYSDWCLGRRRQLREKLFDTLITLARLLKSAGDNDSAIRYYRRILEHDPCLEDVHRDLMEALNACGKRTQALRQFEACRRALKEEFDVAPVMETEALYRKILAG